MSMHAVCVGTLWYLLSLTLLSSFYGISSILGYWRCVPIREVNDVIRDIKLANIMADSQCLGSSPGVGPIVLGQPPASCRELYI